METLDDVVFKSAPDTATAKQIRDALQQLNEEGYVDFKNVGGHRIRVAHLALTQLQGIEPRYRFIAFKTRSTAPARTSISIRGGRRCFTLRRSC